MAGAWRFTTLPDCTRLWRWYASVGPAERVARIVGPCVKVGAIALPLAVGGAVAPAAVPYGSGYSQGGYADVVVPGGSADGAGGAIGGGYAFADGRMAGPFAELVPNTYAPGLTLAPAPVGYLAPGPFDQQPAPFIPTPLPVVTLPGTTPDGRDVPTDVPAPMGLLCVLPGALLLVWMRRRAC